MPASLTISTPALSIVSPDTVVTLTGRFCGFAGSFWAETVGGGNWIVIAGDAGPLDGVCACESTGATSEMKPRIERSWHVRRQTPAARELSDIAGHYAIVARAAPAFHLPSRFRVYD